MKSQFLKILKTWNLAQFLRFLPNFLHVSSNSKYLQLMYSIIGPKTTPSLISKGGYQIPPPLGGREIDTPWEIGLKVTSFDMLEAQTNFCKSLGSQNKSKAIWDIRFQGTRLSDTIYFNLTPHFDLLISRFLDIIQKCFCTPDAAMDPLFRMKYVSAFKHVWSCRNWAKT